MPLSRRPYIKRRYAYHLAPAIREQPAEMKNAGPAPEKIENIPLPNEDDTEDRPSNLQRARSPSIIEFLKKQVRLEDILLVGLIFLLMEEGIEDELLLILLIYILLG